MTQPLWTLPNDARLAHVLAAVSAGVASLPKWGWPMLGPYNGWTGEQRVYAWKIQTTARNLRLLRPPDHCSVCGATGCKLDMHNENYGDPFDYHLICQGDHRMLHARFRNPSPWYSRARLYGRPGAWFADLPKVALAPPEPVPVSAPAPARRVRPPPMPVQPVAPAVQPGAKLAPIQRRFGPPLLLR